MDPRLPAHRFLTHLGVQDVHLALKAVDLRLDLLDASDALDKLGLCRFQRLAGRFRLLLLEMKLLGRELVGPVRYVAVLAQRGGEALQLGFETVAVIAFATVVFVAVTIDIVSSHRRSGRPSGTAEENGRIVTHHGSFTSLNRDVPGRREKEIFR